MRSFSVVCLLVICTFCAADNVDTVQVTVGRELHNQSAERMPCNDKTYGFIPSGDDVTGWLKTCPNDYPYLNTNTETANCQKAMCTVDPDRYTCCRKKECSCLHGTPTEADATEDGLRCEKDQENDCSACDAGYHMSEDAGAGSQTCNANVCSCKNGKQTTASGQAPNKQCEVDGKEDCFECNQGYHMSADAGSGEQTCIANVCSCSNGKPTVATGSGSTLCEKDGDKDCSECNDGWALDAEAGTGTQTCQPKTCHDKTALNGLSNQAELDRAACDASVVTDTKCQLGCADGYTGDSTMWKCNPDGTLTGNRPNCTPNTCEVLGTDVFTQHTKSNCSNAKTGDVCQASCEDGYEGETQVYKCTGTSGGSAGGFKDKDGQTKATPMQCTPKPCTVKPPVNGGLNTCSTTLESGKKCQISCITGYTPTGETQCIAGTLTSEAVCKPSPCDTSVAPAYGEVGDCKASLDSGATCKPTCSSGYTAVPATSSCSKGELTATECKPNLKCQLVYKKTCEDNHGYWTTKDSFLDYPGCEHFCNMKNQETGKPIYGCELTGVTSDARNSKGGWCFAHVNECEIGDNSNTAACKCEKGDYGGHVSQQESALFEREKTERSNAESTSLENDKTYASVESISSENTTSSHKFKRRVR